ncbi:MAG: ABC transporter permease [Chlamydiae bacterium]|nr:ABC transporter permease [Chlamydiota bacterium]MBI3276164.1 ABC transporter permease [Chlamydiota bacterium]
MKNLIFKELWLRRGLLRSLVERNLKIRYKGSLLGFFWSLMDPLMMAVVYLVFIKLTRFQTDLPYLLSGVFIWQFLVLCVGDSFHAILGNTNLVKKVYFPRLILPLATALANLINFLLSLLILIIFLFLLGVKIHLLHLVYLPFLIFLEFMICSGLAFLFSSLTVYFRDTQHVVGIILMALFFMSPVIYPVQLVPERWLTLYLMNPMATILLGFRSGLLGTSFPWGGATIVSCLLSGVIFAGGIWVFIKLEPYFADEL